MNIDMVTDFAKVTCQNYFPFGTLVYSLNKVLSEIRERMDVLFFHFKFVSACTNRSWVCMPRL